MKDVRWQIKETQSFPQNTLKKKKTTSQHFIYELFKSQDKERTLEGNQHIIHRKTEVRVWPSSVRAEFQTGRLCPFQLATTLSDWQSSASHRPADKSMSAPAEPSLTPHTAPLLWTHWNCIALCDKRSPFPEELVYVDQDFVSKWSQDRLYCLLTWASRNKGWKQEKLNFSHTFNHVFTLSILLSSWLYKNKVYNTETGLTGAISECVGGKLLEPCVVISWLWGFSCRL